MKLDYLSDLDPGTDPEKILPKNVLRLYDFDEGETGELVHLIEETLLNGREELRLSEIPFIETMNCSLVLRTGKSDKGVLKADTAGEFVCELSAETWLDAMETMQFTEHGFNWLCETSRDGIDFLYAPDGRW